MEIKRSENRRCGVYLIRNIINGKVYVGASTRIGARLHSHIAALRTKNLKQENEHFINSWHKHGEDKFVYVIIEECKKEQLRAREFFWTNYYKATNPKHGFNKRLDSENGMITHPETRVKLIAALTKRFENQEERDKTGKRFKKFWKDNPEAKAKMSKNVKQAKQLKYKFFKLDEDENILKEYDTVDEIINEHPEYKWQNIYSVCNGYKKRIYGFKWRKELK